MCCIRYSPDVDLQFDGGVTALMLAVRYKHPGVARALLDAKADPRGAARAALLRGFRNPPAVKSLFANGRAVPSQVAVSMSVVQTKF